MWVVCRFNYQFTSSSSNTTTECCTSVDVSIRVTHLDILLAPFSFHLVQGVIQAGRCSCSLRLSGFNRQARVIFSTCACPWYTSNNNYRFIFIFKIVSDSSEMCLAISDSVVSCLRLRGNELPVLSKLVYRTV